MKSRKSLAPILEVSLLLMIVVVAGVYFQFWYTSYNTEKLSKIELTGFKNNVEFISLIKTGSSSGVLYLKTKRGYEVIKEVKIGDSTCILPESNVVITKSTPIKIWCPVPFGVPEVFIVTNSDIYQKSIVVT